MLDVLDKIWRDYRASVTAGQNLCPNAIPGYGGRVFRIKFIAPNSADNKRLIKHAKTVDVVCDLLAPKYRDPKLILKTHSIWKTEFFVTEFKIYPTPEQETYLSIYFRWGLKDWHKQSQEIESLAN